jgi:hypothetical protein
VEHDPKGALKTKLALKWPHPSGFTLDKLEFSNDCKVAVETSLSNAIPNLKVEFKGNDSDKAELSFKYTHTAATVTGNMDVHGMTSADASVTAGHGAFVGGLAAKFNNKEADKVNVDVAITHSVPNVCFTTVRANDNFSNFSLLFSYSSVKNLIVGGQANYTASKKCSGAVVAAYKIDNTTTIKGKATCDGIVSASMKKAFENKFVVVGSAQVPSDLKNVKWGVNATLG